MYLNSELLASGGVVEDSITTAKPYYNSTIVRIPNGLEFFSITIQVSNYHSNWAGLWTPVVIGDADDLHIHQRDKVALSMFILGALLITIIHSLIQFFYVQLTIFHSSLLVCAYCFSYGN
ncbi:hypothetical protein RS130_22540 [Paraglaciecola aquimarina]|uniref:Uncharacterized protein n=1 Tax=Paraglaciecola aquimarina TaxID=1235557 RepID=A0ABU3T1Z9_9ALTE|nr:hypothetical protein [Paraglaciecola aquimarina]MDU0356294.1 hypothetical protein [Paraglaciecola aquimarina]